ncbi:MAG: tRNA 2-thiouridine(34) synthase MnmA [Candidatus Moranbacteria bacterium CG10_big_fil_rev_8_21_14_0_10_35_21]|nr:MAG: tRNA 2-thiouridine(34) synthase MnmA [Candidatus Moranbacteria bacterium CG10_big_fil_rev_8_21_14_0_10_35_21]PJA88747.1 MAG: tRNA 2-thiouridine(34) synthase MnmA [Candidatus Moranbacteria bacterium CG_4_9_14_3_um_filter_36_9]
MAEKKKKKRVIVAMSSGVDSSVAAGLLKKQGYEVVGIFMHFWKEPGQDALRENKCCSLEAQQDARKVAQILDVPLYTVNAAKEFKKEVVDYFLEENESGRTPNPCVVCNERIKFNFLFKKMLEMKADFVASGHYAQVRKAKSLKLKVKNNEEFVYKLYQGKDKEKDQSYFLYNLIQKQLSKIIFPVGKYQKPEIRKIAEKMKLPVFNKDDSQGLCFTPEKYPTEFLKRNLKLKKGKIFDTDGKILGSHQGLPLYTIGQRRGINIGGTGPYYVVDKDFSKNRLLVTNDPKNPDIFKKNILVEKVNWLGKIPKFPLKTKLKIRYRHEAICAIIHPVKSDEIGSPKAKFNRVKNPQKSVYVVEFNEPQKAVTPGQSAVFYSNSGEVLGGGVIKE